MPCPANGAVSGNEGFPRRLNEPHYDSPGRTKKPRPAEKAGALVLLGGELTSSTNLQVSAEAAAAVNLNHQLTSCGRADHSASYTASKAAASSHTSLRCDVRGRDRLQRTAQPTLPKTLADLARLRATGAQTSPAGLADVCRLKLVAARSLPTWAVCRHRLRTGGLVPASLRHAAASLQCT